MQFGGGEVEVLFGVSGFVVCDNLVNFVLNDDI